MLFLGLTAHAQMNSSIATPFKVTDEDINSVSIFFSLPDYQLAPVEARGMKSATVAMIPGCGYTMIEGAPELPVLATSISLNSTISPEVTIINTQYTDYQNVVMAPSPGPGERAKKERKRKPFDQYYENDSFFPENIVDISSPFIIHSERGISLRIVPFQYNPVKKVLRVYHSVEIQLNNTGNEVINPLPKMKNQNPEGAFDDIFNDMFINFSAKESKGYTSPRMMVVAPKNYQSAIMPFVEWKNKKGIDAFVVDAAAFQSAEMLREYVKQEYNTHGLMFLVLVGDADVVPTFVLDNGVSDMSYSYISGDDHYPELFVGRISANSVTDVETQVTRFIRYERAPYTGKDWLSTSLGIASRGGPGHNDEYDYDHIRNIQNRLNDYTYRKAVECYDGSQGGGDLAGDVLTEDVINNINSGVGTIFYTGHASQDKWFTSSFAGYHTEELDNVGMLPVVWSVACHSGAFSDGTCLAESMLRSSLNGQPTGAVGAFMSSGSISWNPPMLAQDAIADLIINSHNESVTTFGGLSVGGCIKMNEMYFWAGEHVADTWVLFGDPSLEVRTTYPANLEVSYPTSIGASSSVLTLKAIAEYAVASISYKGTLIASTEIIDGTGQMALGGLLTDGRTYDLVVTAPNRIPFEGELLVTDAPGKLFNPVPDDNAHLISVLPEFAWSCDEGCNASSFKLFLGTDYPPSNLINGEIIMNKNFAVADLLEHNTTYFWRVDAINEHAVTTGEVWSFSTLSDPDEDFEHFFDKGTSFLMGNPAWIVEKGNPFRGLYSAKTAPVAAGTSCVLAMDCILQNDDFVGFWFMMGEDGSTGSLSFSVNGSIVGEWNETSGWQWIEHSLVAGEYHLEWSYSNDSSTPKSNGGAWIDDIFIPGNRAVYANAGHDVTVCLQDKPIPEAFADAYTKLQWTTDGDGGFDNAQLIRPNYYPGPLDLANGSVTLTLVAINEKTTTENQDTITIYFAYPPDVNIKIKTK